MSVEMKKSKKLFGANSKPQPEPTLFLDRNLGRHIIADRLRSEGMKVEVHDDHLASDAPDEDWIALVGRNHWVAITKDKNIRYRVAELEAIRKHSAQIIVIRAKNATGADIAALLVKGRRRLVRFATITPSPFVGGMYGSGVIKAYPII